MKRKKTSQLRKLYLFFISNQVLVLYGTTQTLFHMAVQAFTNLFHLLLSVSTVSIFLHTSYWSLNSLWFSSSHPLWSSCNRLPHAHGLGNSEKSHEGEETQQSIFLLRGWGLNHSSFCYTLDQRSWHCLNFSSGLPGVFSQGNVERVKCMWLGYGITYDNVC